MANEYIPRTSTRVLSDNDPTWNRIPYQIELGSEFSNLTESLEVAIGAVGPRHVAVQDIDGILTNADGNNRGERLVNAVGANPYVSLGRTYFKDTRLGANDAINCIWQFNRDDDIVHPLMYSEPNRPGIGEGRVYAATTETNQSIAWFSFGIPRFTDMSEFFLRSFDKDLIAANNRGFVSGKSFMSLFGELLGSTVVALPLWAISWFLNLFSKANSFPVDKYYDMMPTMHLYYEYVDSILSTWLVNAGIYGNGDNPIAKNSPTVKDDNTGEITELKTNSYTASPDSLPIALKETGPSIWDIISRRARNIGLAPDSFESAARSSTLNNLMGASGDSDGDSKAALENYLKNSAWSGVGFQDTYQDKSAIDLLKETALGATQFVGFRIEKSVDASESFSNSTTSSPVAEKINSMAKSVVDKRYQLGIGAGGGTNTGTVLDDIMGGLGEFMSSLSASLRIDGISSAVQGGAYIDIPDQYSGSDFSKSHSLSFQLRSPYGDISSIYQSIMVPLAMILAGSLPRSGGTNSYVQPFLCRVYSKGLFSVPLGIIDSVSLKRGSSEFGWTYNNLPTCIDVNISIKDLSPAMYMSMHDGLWNDLKVFRGNTSFDEFMLTLSGTGLWERISSFARIRRNVQLASHKIRNRYTNVNYWGNTVGDSKLIRTIGNFFPSQHVPRN